MVAAAAGLGLVIGVVIGGLGGGGGILTVPVLVYLLGQSAQSATTGSLVIVGATAVAGTVARLRAHLVDGRTALVFGAVGIPSASIGTLLNRHVAEPVLLLSFAALALIASAGMLVHGDGSPEPDRHCPHLPRDPDRQQRPGPGGSLALTRETRDRRRSTTAAAVVGFGLAVGFLTGFLGVGGGFLAVPALVIVMDMPMDLAVGTSLMIIAVNSLASLVPRYGTIASDWTVVVPFTVTAIIGSTAGKRIADRLPGTVLTRAFAGLLAAVGVFVAAESLLAL